MKSDAEFIRDRLVITCADALDLMTVFLDEALGDDDRQRLQTHLAGCEACSVYLDQLKQTVEVVATVKGADSYAVDDQTMDELLERFRETQGGHE